MEIDLRKIITGIAITLIFIVISWIIIELKEEVCKDFDSIEARNNCLNSLLSSEDVIESSNNIDIKDVAEPTKDIIRKVSENG